jgi:hypothetical protein
MSIRPEVGAIKPAIIRNNVDFPQPEGPTRDTNSPEPTSNEALETAVCPEGNTMLTPSHSTRAAERRVDASFKFNLE